MRFLSALVKHIGRETCAKPRTSCGTLTAAQLEVKIASFMAFPLDMVVKAVSVRMREPTMLLIFRSPSYRTYTIGQISAKSWKLWEASSHKLTANG
jgi:hypothetical protein